MSHICTNCKRADVRLYRPYGEFLRETRIACNSHIPNQPESFGYWVPLREDLDGTVWGHFAARPDSIARWEALPDADPAGPVWRNGQWEQGGVPIGK